MESEPNRNRLAPILLAVMLAVIVVQAAWALYWEQKCWETYSSSPVRYKTEEPGC